MMDPKWNSPPVGPDIISAENRAGSTHWSRGKLTGSLLRLLVLRLFEGGEFSVFTRGHPDRGPE